MTDETGSADNLEWLRKLIERSNFGADDAERILACADELQQLRAEREGNANAAMTAFQANTIRGFIVDNCDSKEEESALLSAFENLRARIAALEAEQGEHSALMEFYNAATILGLVAAMAHHIEKLQSKLPPTRDEQHRTPREG